MIDHYLNDKSGYISSGEDLKKLFRTPGMSAALYKYLSGPGSNRIPDIVRKNLGNHWYTDMVSKLSNTSKGREFALNHIMNKVLPTINGDNSLAIQCMQAGGVI